MAKIVGIRFKPAGKIYHFDSGVFVLNLGDKVIVETERGLSFGEVAILPQEIEKNSRNDKPLKKIFRLANAKDFNQIEKNVIIEKEARTFCKDCIGKLGLKMNLFAVESTFDSKKITFFFTADGRVDFRELVKILVKKLGVRIEMRQVGIRHQAKMCGGISRCGRVLCCSSFMDKFSPVSIRMVKAQGLSLNPTKISGQCGRLMCCLRFEDKTYRGLAANFPKVGKVITFKGEKMKVIRHDLLRQTVVVIDEDSKEMKIPVGDIPNIKTTKKSNINKRKKKVRK